MKYTGYLHYFKRFAFVIYIISILSIFPAVAQNTDTSKVLAKDAKLQLISGQFSFTEGPAPDKKGNIFFTDQPNDKIWEYKTDGTLSLFMDKAGRSNGLYFDPKGNLISCADENDEVWSISPDKKVTVLIKNYQGKKLNGPNDVWVDKKGGIYLTDPYYQRDYWTRKSPDIKEERVYYMPPGKKELVVADESLKKPNGIVGTPDGKTLYVADIGGNKTYRFKIGENGALSERTVFTDRGSDGITLDNMGNVYMTGNGVTVFNPEGIRIEHINVPAGWTSNVCFGGKKKNKLFITASEKVFIIDMKVKGIE